MLIFASLRLLKAEQHEQHRLEQTITMQLPWQVLEFETKKEMTLEMWTDRQDKIQTFFGPGVTADIEKSKQVAHLCSCHLVACLLAHMHVGSCPCFQGMCHFQSQCASGQLAFVFFVCTLFVTSPLHCIVIQTSLFALYLSSVACTVSSYRHRVVS